MKIQKQKTISDKYSFEGKGLHTGRYAHMTICPAPVNTGIVFRRTDLGAEVKACAANVSSTARSTTISDGQTSVSTIEHVLSALTGFGIDNAIIEIDNVEVPILDGSARLYCKAFESAPLVEQEADRKLLTVKEVVEIKDEKTGSYVRVSPADSFEYDVTVDFSSKVLGVQTAHWDENVDYGYEIGRCRTFVFFHEIEYLFSQNLVKGGDVENAIVIVEHPASEEQVNRLSSLFGIPALKVNENGYLNNLELRFSNECGRHKLLDLIGDLRLCGGIICARIEAYKPGHSINTRVAKALGEALVELA